MRLVYCEHNNELHNYVRVREEIAYVKRKQRRRKKERAQICEMLHKNVLKKLKAPIALKSSKSNC